MNEIQLRLLHKLSANHRFILEHQIGTANVSCFYCLKVSALELIEDWTDGGDTALCPHCSIDSILPGNLAREDLEAMREFYFSPVHTSEA